MTISMPKRIRLGVWFVSLRMYPPSVTAAYPLAPLIEDQLPEVLHTTRIMKYWFDPVLSTEEEGFYEPEGYFVDEHFFDVFDFPLAAGSAEAAFNAPNAILLTRPLAEKLFGSEDPIGRSITYNASHDFVVTGVFDEIPGNSHFSFRYLLFSNRLADLLELPLDTWGFNAFHTYVVAAPNVDSEQLGQRITGTVQAHSDDEGRYFVQPISDIHLRSDYGGELQANSDIRFVWLLLGIAGIILLLACVNYTNLTISLFNRRLREVGVRKTVGASRSQLFTQFLIESLLLTLLAFCLAVITVELVVPFAQGFTGQQISLNPMGQTIFIGAMLGVALLTGLISGLYPAWIVSRHQSLGLMQGIKTSFSRRTLVLKGLVAGQFALATLLIFNTFLLYQQLDFMQNKKLGYEEERVIVAPVRDPLLLERPALVKQQFLNNPAVAAVASSATLPTLPAPATTLAPLPDSQREPFKTFFYFIDEAYLETFGITLIAGGNFEASDESDEANPAAG